MRRWHLYARRKRYNGREKTNTSGVRISPERHHSRADGRDVDRAPGTNEIRSFKPSKLGLVLQNGDLYLEDEVRRLAMMLLKKQPPPKEAVERDERPSRYGSRT